MHHDNWLFWLFAGIALLFQLLSRAATKAKKESDDEPTRSTSTPQPPPPPTPQLTRADSQQEQIRKFLEALGRPESSSPPPVVRPRTDVPPRPVAPVTPPNVFVPTARKIARAEKTFARTKEVRPPMVKAEQPPPPLPTPSTYEVVRRDENISPPARNNGRPSLIDLLRSPNGLRDAMVLREIFGPPRSMQDVDLVGFA